MRSGDKTKRNAKRIAKRSSVLTVEDLFTDPVPVKLPPGVIEPYRKPVIGKEAKEAELFKWAEPEI